MRAASRKIRLLLFMIASITVLALSGTAVAATNPACDMSPPGGFQICVTQSNPVDLIYTYAYHASGTPYQFGAYNQSIASWQGGPWTRYSTGDVLFLKNSGWNWSGVVRHQVDNQGPGPGVARYYATIG